MNLLIWATHPHASGPRQYFADGMAGGPDAREGFCEITPLVRGDGADEVVILAPE
jgi:hypothetical protein